MLISLQTYTFSIACTEFVKTKFFEINRQHFDYHFDNHSFHWVLCNKGIYFSKSTNIMNL